MSLTNIHALSGISGGASLVNSASQSKQPAQKESFFYFFVAEQLAQQTSSSSCSSNCCFGPTMQSFLKVCRINIRSKSCLEKELAYQSGSKVLARAFILEQKVSCCITTRRAQQLKKDFFMSWSDKTLSNLQLLNLAKVSVEIFFDIENPCKFFPSNDPKLDGLLVKDFYYIPGGLRLEEKLLEELLMCLPFDNSISSEFLLNNKDDLWGHFSSNLFQNYPPSYGKAREVSLQDILRVFVCTIKGLEASFSPSSSFLQFVLEYKGIQDFLANSPEHYASGLLDFYNKHMHEDDSQWIVGGSDGTSRTRFSNALTTQEQSLIFNKIKA